ncbi:hypothetical protein Tsubulata_000672, partial [Turnera subulata]
MGSWTKAPLESPQLLQFCIKKPGKDMHKNDQAQAKNSKGSAQFNGADLEQSYVVKYVQQNHIILLMFIPLTSSRWTKVLVIEATPPSLWSSSVGLHAPLRSRHDKQLVSMIVKAGIYCYKHTFSVEICPICRQDLICLPQKIAAGLGNFGPLISTVECLLTRFTSRQFVEYIVLDVVEPVSLEALTITAATPYKLADVQVAHVSDFGRNDTIFYMRTHLGHCLNVGDKSDKHGKLASEYKGFLRGLENNHESRFKIPILDPDSKA